MTDSTGASTSLGWQGDYTDPTTGLVNMGARWYQPETGGFITRDSYSGAPTLPVSLNRYTYANGNPLEFTDPTGYCGFSLSGLVDCVTSAAGAVTSTVSTGARYVVTGITTGIGYATSAINRAWNAGAEVFKSFAATAYRGVTQTAAATFGAAKGVATTVRKAGTYNATTLLNFGGAALGKAKGCLTTSGTCRTVVTAVAVAAVAVACTACLLPMAVGAGLGAGAGALTCPADQDRGMCALRGGLSGALAGTAGLGAAGALGRTALAGSRLAQFTMGGAAAGLADESSRQFMDGELNPTRIVAATVAGAGLGAATHGTIRAASKLSSAIRSRRPTANRYPGSTPNVHSPTGKLYTVAYEVELDPSVLGRSRDVHFNRANRALDDAFRSDPEFAAGFEQMAPGTRSAVSSTGGRERPPGYTWHHVASSAAQGRVGVMHLVPTVQHEPGSIWQAALHPGGMGGYAEWAIPRGAPRN